MADFVVGNNAARKFVLVEFENGQHDSLFKGGKSNYRYWSPRLEHGFGQIIDWAWVKHIYPMDPILVEVFRVGLLIVAMWLFVVAARMLGVSKNLVSILDDQLK